MTRRGLTVESLVVLRSRGRRRKASRKVERALTWRLLLVIGRCGREAWDGDWGQRRFGGKRAGGGIETYVSSQPSLVDLYSLVAIPAFSITISSLSNSFSADY